MARDFLALTKPGIVRLVTITSGVGFALALVHRGWGSVPLGEVLLMAAACIVGTALSAAGANTLNQCMEVRRDALMTRTRLRPIPAHRLTVAQAAAFGAALSALGIGVLWVGANPVAAVVSIVTTFTYLFIYTPMKSVTPLATWVGAVPGALPPLIGWAAASDGAWRGLDHPGGWTIFLIMFAWQIPHFLALAWKYRDDYARGGYRVLSLNDHSGLATAWQSVIWTLIMIALSLTPVWAMRNHVGWAYAVSAVLLGCGMLHLSVTLLATRSDRNARNLFLGSVVYLPIVLFVLVADAARSVVG
ncbi:MAG: protoheme IX farnesyltransferase [Phycisphaerae bacterium]|nr:protoheme IX farnesyltransferase [Phycisphaerae bacterium]